MEIREFGRGNKKSILLLPPKYMTSRIFEVVIHSLSNWHIFCVSYDGFEDEKESRYESAQIEADKIVNKLQDFEPFDIVFGHGLGACVESYLPRDFARRFIFSGIESYGSDNTLSMLKLIMPKKHLKVLNKIKAHTTQKEIATILSSQLPINVWKESMPDIFTLESVENALKDDLGFLEILPIQDADKDKLSFWFSKFQKFPVEHIEEIYPEAHITALPTQGKDEILFSVKTFNKLLDEELKLTKV